jgi:hypothetical protein
MSRRIAVGSVLSVLIASAPLAAQVVPQYWSVVASTGIADESSTSKVSFADAGSAFFKSGATGTIQLRYPVIPSGELEKVKDGQSEGFFCLDVIYRDTGPGSRVIVRLLSTDGEFLTEHMTFDSDTLPATGTAYESNGNMGDPVCGSPRFFDTARRAYFVEVLLTKTTSTANPGVRVIKILDSQQFD